MALRRYGFMARKGTGSFLRLHPSLAVLVPATVLSVAIFASPAAQAQPKLISQPKLIKKTAPTTVEAAATKDAEGNLTVTVSLASSKKTCLNAGRVLVSSSRSGQPVGPPVFLGYGSELLQVERGPWSIENQGEPSEGVAYGANPDKSYDFSLAQASAPEVSPWIWQGTWPGAQPTSVRSEHGSPAHKPTVATASFVHIAMTLYLHRKLYKHRTTRELITCPGKRISRWIAL